MSVPRHETTLLNLLQLLRDLIRVPCGRLVHVLRAFSTFLKSGVDETRHPRAIRAGRIAGLLLGPLLLVIVLVLPMSLSREQQSLFGVILMTVTYWVTRALPIPVTSILALALAAVLDIASARTIFGAFSSPTLFLLIGGFIITQAMIKYGLGQRIALRVLSIPGVAGSTYRIVIVFGALAALLSSVIDNGAVAAMLLPIGLGLIRCLDDDVREAAGIASAKVQLRFASALMLITAYGATVGALLTPFGDGSNLVGWYFIDREFGVRIPVGTWMALATPIVLALFAALCGLVLLMNRPEAGRLPHAARDIGQQVRRLGAMSRGEFNTAMAFGTAVILWMLPPLAGVAAGYSSPAYLFLASRLNPAVVAILAATLLFMMPVSRKEGFTLQWDDMRRMDWAPVLLMGSGLALANLMGKTGLAEVMGNALAASVQDIGEFGVYLFAATMSMMFSELTSNLVSISIVVPVIPSLTLSGGGEPLHATLIATFAAVYGFMLPISTSANVIIYGSGHVPFLRMLRTGLLVDVSGVLIVVGGVLAMLNIVTIR